MVRRGFGEELACFREGRSVRWMPLGWTSLAAPDSFLEASAGRAWFRPEDLVRVADLIEGLRGRASIGEEASDA
jgi:hypothetical protein